MTLECLDCGHTWDTRPTAPERINQATDSPADLLRAAWDWRHELAAAGWTIARDGHDSFWTRPGKPTRDGHSAVLHGDQVLVVFTTAVDDAFRRAGVRTADGSGYSFSPYAFYAATRHHGDLQAAGRELRGDMERPGSEPPGRSASAAPQGPDGNTPFDAEASVEDDWTSHDLAGIAQAILDGTHEPEQPTMLLVDGGLPLLYAGRIHSIFGPPGGGKTWVAAYAVAERIQTGEHVLVIDWEDVGPGFTKRLVQLGCTPAQVALVDYRNPASSLLWGISNHGLLDNATPWTLVVIDSAGEALAAQGVELVDDTGTAAWFQLAKRFTVRPERPAVLMLDHVPKTNGDEPPKFAIGSQRKLAAITGASYRCDTVKEFAKGRPGLLKLVVAKDRLGTRPKGWTACEITVDGTEEAVAMEARVSEAQAAAERGERFRPTHLMERVSRFVEINPGASRHTIETSVEGKAKSLRAAIDVLIEEGWIAVSKVGQAFEHRSVRDYREADEAVDNLVMAQPRPTSSHLVPTSSRDEVRSPGATSSPRPRPSIDGDEGRGRWNEQGDQVRPPVDSQPLWSINPETGEPQF